MLTPHSAIQPANADAVLIPGGAGTIIRRLEAFNNSASHAYLKLYNSPPETAPTAGSTPVLRKMIPSGSGFNEDINPTLFTQGCWYRVTRNLADNDTTAVAANEVIVNVYR